jgi:NTP pyrophosphatase (non-canonical NTP hydrolase)
MDFNEYQVFAGETAQYPQEGNNMAYPMMGLSGEAGEALDKVKKIWRNQGTYNAKVYNPEQRIEIAKELGDVLWYLAAAASELGYTLDIIAQMNIAKLRSRRERGVILSEGDNR